MGALHPPGLQRGRSASGRTATEPQWASSRSPRPTDVAELETMMPASFRPMKAMNRPTPPATAENSARGIAATINLAHPGEREQHERSPRDEHATEGGLPWHAHALDDGVGEIGVHPHPPGASARRIVGKQPHQDRAEGGGQAGSGGDGCDRHAGVAHDRGVDHDDVGHRQERGEAREHFCADGRSMRSQAEESLQHAPPSVKVSPPPHTPPPPARFWNQMPRRTPNHQPFLNAPPLPPLPPPPPPPPPEPLTVVKHRCPCNSTRSSPAC